VAWVQSDYDALTKAIAQGATSVRYGDRQITYRSLAEMLQLRQQMAAELGLNSSRIARKFASYSSGLS